ASLVSTHAVPFVPNEQYNRPSSIIGDGEANELSVWIGSGLSSTIISRLCRNSPESRSTQRARIVNLPERLRDLAFGLPSSRAFFSSSVNGVSMAVVIQICRPSITGDDHAFPGSSVRQATFFVSLQVTGKSVPAACP